MRAISQVSGCDPLPFETSVAHPACWDIWSVVQGARHADSAKFSAWTVSPGIGVINTTRKDVTKHESGVDGGTH